MLVFKQTLWIWNIFVMMAMQLFNTVLEQWYVTERLNKLVGRQGVLFSNMKVVSLECLMTFYNFTSEILGYYFFSHIHVMCTENDLELLRKSSYNLIKQ